MLGGQLNVLSELFFVEYTSSVSCITNTWKKSNIFQGFHITCRILMSIISCRSLLKRQINGRYLMELGRHENADVTLGRHVSLLNKRYGWNRINKSYQLTFNERIIFFLSLFIYLLLLLSVICWVESSNWQLMIEWALMKFEYTFSYSNRAMSLYFPDFGCLLRREKEFDSVNVFVERFVDFWM